MFVSDVKMEGGRERGIYGKGDGIVGGMEGVRGCR